MERRILEDMYLSGRKCLSVPKYLCASMEEYAKIVYELMKSGWDGEKVKFVICCYSRKTLPRYYSDTCVIADYHYLEFLGDLAHWYRLKDNHLLESIFCKYMKNSYLANNDYANATLYEWLIKEKQFVAPLFSDEDYLEAFRINITALLHESTHFLKGFEEYEALYNENDIDKHVKNNEEVLREGKCDFMGLLLLLKKGEGLGMTQEQKVEKYCQMIASNCFFINFEDISLNTSETSPATDNFMDRIYSTVNFLCGMRSLFPDLDMHKVNLDIVKEYADGLEHIGQFMIHRLTDYANEYNELTEPYKESICNEMKKQETELREGREYVVYPKIFV